MSDTMVMDKLEVAANKPKMVKNNSPVRELVSMFEAKNVTDVMVPKVGSGKKMAKKEVRIVRLEPRRCMSKKNSQDQQLHNCSSRR